MATILIVDDQPTNLEVLTTLLAYQGHRLLEAASGTAALELAQTERPDLVIADIVMPTMDGYEFVRQLRADPTINQPQVVFYTATYNDREARTLARDCGVEHILSKPAEPQLILDTVAAALGAAKLPVEPPPNTFDRDHTRLLTDKLASKVEELEAANRMLQRRSAALEQEVEQRKQIERRQAMQVAVTRILAESDTRYEAVPLIIETISLAEGCDLGELWRLDQQAHVLRWEHSWNRPGLSVTRFEAASLATTVSPEADLCGRVWASARPAWVEDIAADQTFLRAAIAAEIGLRTAFAFPIPGGIDAHGVMVFFYRNMRRLDAELLDLLADIGSQIGQFFERKYAEEQLWQYTQRLRTMRAIDQAILAVQSPEAIAQAALRHIRQLIPCRHANVMALDFDAAAATVWAVDASGTTNLAAGMRYPLDRLSTIDILMRGEPQSVIDVDEVAQHDALAQLARSEGLRALLSVPLTSQGHLIGALNLASDQPASFTPELITIAGEVGDQLAIAIQNAQLFEQVRVGREQLQSLSRQLVRAQEDERRHLARELHDEIGQALTATQLNLQALLTLRDRRELPARLEDSMALIEGLLQQVRALSLDLRPSMLDDLGLAPALRWYLNRQAERAGFAVQFVVESSEMRYPSEIETTCFRIAQETVTNIVRHAQAQLVYVELQQRSGELCLLIRDDGVGFDVGAARARAGRGASLGLLGMQERAMLIGGQISIESAPGQGTMVCARFPLADRSGGIGPFERQRELP